MSAESYSREIAEQVVEGKRLGRHVLHDPRSRNYPAEQAGKLVSVAHKTTGLPLDQGQIGSCTANALVGALNSAPDFKGHVLTETDAVSVYELETQLEFQPYPPNDPGGTGLLVCQAARQMGLIRAFTHGFGLQSSLLALVKRPVIFGVDWYEGFDDPDSAGLVKIAGDVRGGHEILAAGIDAPGKEVWFVNSWGLEYGVAAKGLNVAGGAFAMSFDTLGQLLHAEGDCTVPIV
jgi:hypothetical protein